jgi:hypothetical protein
MLKRTLVQKSLIKMLNNGDRSVSFVELPKEYERERNP